MRAPRRARRSSFWFWGLRDQVDVLPARKLFFCVGDSLPLLRDRHRPRRRPTHLVDETGRTAWHTRTTLWGTTTWNRDATAHTALCFPGHDPETGGLHYLRRKSFLSAA
ncbi:hypothetical protein GCM10028832_06050 [Streptomyces sparsus]